MLTNAARSLSRLALVACLLLVAIAVAPALAATTATDDSPAVEPTLVTALQLLTNDGVSAGQASALSVTGDANPAHWRTIGWEVDKSADVASQNVPVGGEATFDYTVSVTHDDGTPSWEVSGQLTVENPNSGDVTDVVVSNAVDDPNATCVVVGESSTIPANGSAVFDYSCSYSAAPASSSQTSTATISWPAQTLADSSSLAAGSASTSATVVWGGPLRSSAAAATCSTRSSGIWARSPTPIRAPSRSRIRTRSATCPPAAPPTTTRPLWARRLLSSLRTLRRSRCVRVGVI